MGGYTVSQNTITLWNVYLKLRQNGLFFSSLNENESMAAMKFAHEHGLSPAMSVEEINVDEVDFYFDNNTNERNELGIKYHAHKQGEKNGIDHTESN